VFPFVFSCYGGVNDLGKSAPVAPKLELNMILLRLQARKKRHILFNLGAPNCAMGDL